MHFSVFYYYESHRCTVLSSFVSLNNYRVCQYRIIIIVVVVAFRRLNSVIIVTYVSVLSAAIRLQSHSTGKYAHGH